MRWIFYSLIVINLGFLLWQLVPDDEPASVPAARVDSNAGEIASIALLHEAPEQAEPYEMAELSQELEAAQPMVETRNIASPVAAGEQLCDALGPFIDRDQGDRLAGTLQNQGVQASLVSEFVQLAAGYWVYIKPQASTEAALRLSGKLKRQGVAAYLISEGELSNGLSLGIFNHAAAAESLRERTLAVDVAAVVEEKTPVHEEFWVLLTDRDFASIEADKLLQLQGFNAENQVIKKVCKPVASTP